MPNSLHSPLAIVESAPPETSPPSPSAPQTSEPTPSTVEVCSQATPEASERSPRREVDIFVSTFLTIFVAELGDKTQITTLLMAAESQSPWIVFLGAGSALVLTSLLGVWVGRWLATRFSPRTLETVVGGILLLISILLVWDVVHI